MTLKTNARLAGFTFLIYIVIGITTLMLSGQITDGLEGTSPKLAGMSQNTTTMQVIVLLTLMQAGFALVLAVTIYALTRDQDRDLAMMAMCCRVGEGIVIVAAPLLTLSLLTVARERTSATGADDSVFNALGGLLLKIESSTGIIAAICFAVGSTFYTYLFLRAKSIPVWLAWLGVFASVILVVILPLHLAGFVDGMVTKLVWMPMLVFELVFAFWLILKGVRRADSERQMTGINREHG